MPSVLVTGANRGIGLELTRQYLEDGWQVYATCRDPQRAQALTQLQAERSGLTVLAADMREPGEIDALARQLSGQPLDLLITNAGVYGDEPGRGFGSLDYERWRDVLAINTLAPVELAEALLPNLRLGNQRMIVAMTSLMGSMADNSSGGSILYRTSKAALNAAMKSIAIDLKPQGFRVLILHPGWVKTDMGGSNAPTSVLESCSGMRKVIAEFRLDQTGEFRNFRGAELPW